jgi:cleavage and polyadenylation specificity factor subunit 2
MNANAIASAPCSLFFFPSQFEDNEVGFVTGRITTSASSNVPVLEPTNQASLSATHPSSALPRVLGARQTQRLPHSTMIGELKLTALKARLVAVGVQAELIGEGVLVCRGGDADTVAVRKSARGQVELEGTVCDTYYKVRKEIYKLHALVSA